MTKLAGKLVDIINKNDKDLMVMINYIKTNSRKGFDNKNKFKVFSLEASRGKTIGSAFAMSEAILNESNTKYVFTTKTKKECKRVDELITNECKSDFTEISNNTSNDIAMVYTPGKEEDTFISSNDFYKCSKAKVLIITHSTYLNLSRSKTKIHKDYADNVKKYFNTLIIDEEINVVVDNMCTFNNNIYESTLQLLKSTNNIEIIGAYNCICNILKETINFYINNIKYKDKIIIAEKPTIKIIPQIIYDGLITRINMIDRQVIKDYGIDNKTYVELNDILDSVEKIYMVLNNLDFDKVLYWNGTLYSCDFDFKFLMLEKNIMLDASANFNTLYNSEIFKLIKSERIIDHINCNLFWHNHNTSRSAKKKTSDNNQLTDWRKFIISDIKRKAKKDTDVLIITNKAECISLEDEFVDEEFKKYFPNYKFLNFFNMRGIDECADYTEGFMIHTPRFPYPMYILMYMYYIMKEDMDIFKLDMKYGKYRGSNSIGFKDKTLDGLLFSDEISSLYQGCKRICRSDNPKGNFHIYNSNFEVIKAIQNELLNVKIIPDEDNKRAKLSEHFYFILEKIRDGAYKDYKVLNLRTGKQVKAVKSIKKRYYEVSKKLFYEVLEIDSKHFSRDIIEKVNEKENNIKFESETIRIYFN